jgi:hypothetical protein
MAYTNVFSPDVDGNASTGYFNLTNVYSSDGLTFKAKTAGYCTGVRVDTSDGLAIYDLVYLATAADADVTWTETLREVGTVDEAAVEAIISATFNAGTHTGITPTIVDGSVGLALNLEYLADYIANTLLVAGSNVTVTYDDTAGTITIAAAGGGGGSATSSLFHSTVDSFPVTSGQTVFTAAFDADSQRKAALAFLGGDPMLPDVDFTHVDTTLTLTARAGVADEGFRVFYRGS